MEVSERKEKNFMAYDYKEIVTDSNRASFLLDGYECFGWETDEKFSGIVGNVTGVPLSAKVSIRLKRNRKILNKMELTRLQRNYEACVKEIAALESAKTANATMNAIIIGVIGTAFMAGSVFCVTAQPPLIIPCILLAIPAFIGWALPLPIYRETVTKQTERINPLIEAKYDEIYEICEKGNKLLY